MNSTPVHIEICQTSIKVLKEDAGLELPLERAANGRLTAGCKEKLATELQTFLDRKPWQPRVTAFCAISANGVSLRRLSLPATAKNELQRLLLLQIESEFPLSPEELAWGWQTLSPAGAATKQEILVAAVRQEVVADYAEALSAGGLKPVFTLAALARAELCPKPLNDCALLHVNGSQAELMTFENGAPVAVRVVGASAIAESAAKALGPNWSGRKIFLTGASDDLASQITQRFSGITVETLVTESGTGRSAAIHGQKKLVAEHGVTLPLMLQVKAKTPRGSFNFSAPDVKQWAVRAAVLLCALLILPYAEALLLKPFLARKLTALKADKGRLATIDRELDFLQSLKQTQPPYLDAMYLMAKFAPQGSKIDSLTMNRRGEVSLRGSMRDASQVTDFRTKLIGSGFFSTIAVEEQTPTPDRQKLNIRLSAQWKPIEARAGLTNGPTTAEIEKAKSGGKDAKGGSAMPPGMMPPGTFPGGALPAGIPPEVLKQIQAAQAAQSR
jgi:hypothetical protein